MPFALERAPGSRAEFVARFGPGASTSDRRTGVPAAVTLGQGILESGDGQHTAGANNYFGIKAAHKGGQRYRWGDEAVGCVFRKTKEQRPDGSEYTVLAAFRLYRSATDSFVDHSEFLSESSRYRPAFAVKDDSRAFVRAIWKAGYATDTQYPQKVISLMDANDLYRFDVR
ncbi:glucosaminidase domain-containing protein [Patulibacter brassicae]|uniref:Glucosaminidase domain-containing protein n=1 Tax=Patulibacter brassicae TaxID=1705717 RepID=A0ABU4VLH9_9ACTN|nr:glucosaminidase domain-containing protein [Patulibacter brassicae]MDX8151728.1 glucosaminidase domain-containing protein [Patulibacter brassicae]